jgi:hypothetical protein
MQETSRIRQGTCAASSLTALARAARVVPGMRVTLEWLGTPSLAGVADDETTRRGVSSSDGGRAADDVEVGTSNTSAPPPTTCRDDSTAHRVRVSEHPRDVARATESKPARLAILVPFREDGTGREAQLAALLTRLASVFRFGACFVVIAEQSDDGRKFNRGQLLNSAFAYVREHLRHKVDARTLYCFHDCDMLPDGSLESHYARGPPEGTVLQTQEERELRGGFVRVLCADGGRYDVDSCFGGVTLYDARGFERTNGYPNGFWGWGGEDNAQFLRCARANLLCERVWNCPFEDLEGLATATEKLAKLNSMNARCGTKEKRKLLKENARTWRSDGLCSLAYDLVSVETKRLASNEFVSNEFVSNDSSQRESPKERDALEIVRVRLRLRAGIGDEIECVSCGARKAPSGFASHQRKRAMFYASRDKKPATGGDEKLATFAKERRGEVTEKELFWREQNRIRRACHWDERGGETRALDVGDAIATTRSPSASVAEETPETSKDESASSTGTSAREDSTTTRNPRGVRTPEAGKKNPRSARCLACVARDPRVMLFQRQVALNATDASRTICCFCGVKLETRNRLFEHLKTSPCGSRDGEGIKGHVSA